MNKQNLYLRKVTQLYSFANFSFVFRKCNIILVYSIFFFNWPVMMKFLHIQAWWNVQLLSMLTDNRLHLLRASSIGISYKSFAFNKLLLVLAYQIYWDCLIAHILWSKTKLSFKFWTGYNGKWFCSGASYIMEVLAKFHLPHQGSWLEVFIKDAASCQTLFLCVFNSLFIDKNTMTVRILGSLPKYNDDIGSYNYYWKAPLRIIYLIDLAK